MVLQVIEHSISGVIVVKIGSKFIPSKTDDDDIIY